MKKLFSVLFLFTISWTSLYANNTLNFDGNDDYVNVTPFTLGESMTFETWLKFDSNDPWAAIFDFGDALTINNTIEGTNSIILTQYPDGRLLFSIRDGDNNTEIPLGSGVPTLNEWMHVAITVDASAGDYSTVKIYVNGVLTAISSSFNIAPTKTRAYHYIGKSTWTGADSFDGSIDEFRVWSDVRTSEEISANMNKELLGNETGLIAYYNFNEADGTSLIDRSTNSYDGTLTNFPATPTRASSSPSTLTLDDATITTTKYDNYIHQFTSTTDGWGITYSISGGADAAKFTINSESGVLTFVDSNDSKTDATYSLEITATSGSLSSTKTYSVVVENVNRTLAFDGVDDYVQLPDSLSSAAISGKEAITIEYWYKGSSLNSPVRFQDDSGNYVVAGWQGKSFVISTDGGTDNSLSFASEDIVSDGQWHHIAMTWERNTTNGFALYLDGQLYASRDSADVALPTIVGDNSYVNLGTLHSDTFNSYEEFINGSLDEVRIWSDARTAEEISANMNKELLGNETGLIAYYNFNEADGTSLIDRSTNSYDGTLTNFPATPTRASSSPSTLTLDDATITTTKYDNYIHQFTSTTDGWGITYSINGGADAAKFNIDSGSGVLTFVDTNDSKSNATYSIDVTATSSSLSNTKTYSVVVGNTNRTLEFDGIDDYIAIADDMPIPTQDFTIEAWIKPDSLAGNQNILREEWTMAFMLNGTKFRSHFSDGTNWNGDGGIDSNADLVIGEWTHVAVTRTDGTVKLYINGILDKEVTGIASFTIANSSHPFRIGTNGVDSEYFDGQIDEVRVWNTVRSEADIQATMLQELNGNETGLVSYYDFNEASGTTLIDRSTNSYDGTLINFADTSAAKTEFVVITNTDLDSINFTENNTSVVVDIDAINATSFSISGTDSGLFNINSSTGEITFKSSPNYENPTDDGANNIYDLNVTASNGSGSDTQTITITVTDVNEDADNDGILDGDEGADETPPRDTDGDGTPDYQDTDSDNDGIDDSAEGTGDSDGDGVPDYADINNISLSSDSADTDWISVLHGANFDPTDDLQAQAAIDLIGNNDANNSLMYMYFDDKNTSDSSDDELFIRVRTGKNTLDNSSNLNGYIWMGMDVDIDNDLDTFLMLTGKNGTEKLIVYNAGRGANTSPNTTDIDNPTEIVDFDSDTDLSVDSVETIDGTDSALDAIVDPAKDFYVTFKLNFDDFAAIINAKSLTDTSVKNPATVSTIDNGIGFTKDTKIRYMIATAMNTNTLNGDIGGYGASDDYDTSYASQGVFSPVSNLSQPVDITTENQTPLIDKLSEILSVNKGSLYSYTLVANDPESDALTWSSVTLPSWLSLSGDVLSGTPSKDDVGVNAVELSLSDGTNTISYKFSVDVVNIVPITSEATFQTNEDTEGNFDLSTYASDENTLDVLIYEIVSIPSYGTISLNGSTITYTPNTNYYGMDTLTFKVSDENNAVSNISTINIDIAEVNDIPVASDDSVTTPEDTQILIDVLANDKDDADELGELDPSSLEIADDPRHGSVEVVAGKIVYFPELNYNGSDSFAYTVKDNGLITTSEANEKEGVLISNVATVAVTISSLNDAPIANNDFYSINENDVNSTLLISLNDTDVDSIINRDNITIVTDVSNGTLVKGSDGILRYTPTTNYVGNDLFTYTIKDSLDALSNIATVYISMNDVEYAPVSFDDTITIDEDTQYLGQLSAIDNDDDNLTYNITTQPTHGTLNVGSEGNYTYIPEANYNGSDSFRFTTSDELNTSNIAIVSITINSVNDKPIITTETTINVLENTTSVIDVNATDADGDISLNFAIAGGSDEDKFIITSDGILSFKIAPDYENPTDIGGEGEDNIYILDINVSDGKGGVYYQTLNIIVSNSNEAPIITSGENISVYETLTFAGVITATDVENDTLTYSMSGTDVNLFDINAVTGAITFKIAPDYENPIDSNSDNVYEINVTVTDNGQGTLSDTKGFKITVLNVNEVPTISSIANIEKQEDFGDFNVSFQINDVDKDDLNITLTNNADSLFTVTLNGTNPFGYSDYHNNDINLTLSSIANRFGSGSVILTVNDANNYMDATTFVVNVPAVLDFPNISDEQISLDEDFGEFNITLTDIDYTSAGSVDINYTIDDAIVILPNNITNVTDASKIVTLTSLENIDGDTNLTITIKSGTEVVSKIIPIKVNAVNDRPIITGTPTDAKEDEAYSWTPTFSDIDNLNSELNFVAHKLPSWLELNTTSGELSGTPSFIDSGVSDINISVNDGILSTYLETNITVSDTNRAPIITAISDKTIKEDENITVEMNIIDPDGDSVNYNVTISDDENVTLTYTSSSITLVPDANWYGDVNITIDASDLELNSTISFILHITDVIDVAVKENDDGSTDASTSTPKGNSVDVHSENNNTTTTTALDGTVIVETNTSTPKSKIIIKEDGDTNSTISGDKNSTLESGDINKTITMDENGTITTDFEDINTTIKQNADGTVDINKTTINSKKTVSSELNTTNVRVDENGTIHVDGQAGDNNISIVLDPEADLNSSIQSPRGKTELIVSKDINSSIVIDENGTVTTTLENNTTIIQNGKPSVKVDNGEVTAYVEGNTTTSVDENGTATITLESDENVQLINKDGEVIDDSDYPKGTTIYMGDPVVIIVPPSTVKKVYSDGKTEENGVVLNLYAPIIETINNITKDEDFTTFNIEINASDIDSQTLTYGAELNTSAIVTMSRNNNILSFSSIDNTYGSVRIDVNVSDGNFTASSSFIISVTKRIGPKITSNGGNSTSTIHLTENKSNVTTVLAIGTGDILYSITGGADQGLFSIDSITGALTFVTTPTYVKDGDNEYEVIVTAQDDNGISSQTLTITITEQLVYDVNKLVNNRLKFNDSTNIVGDGKNQGDIVRFNNIGTIDGQTLDAVITTTTSTADISTYDSTKNPTKEADYFQPLFGKQSGDKYATFTIKFYKNGTYTGVGTGTVVTLLNVYVNSYDIDVKQYQTFRGFDEYSVGDNSIFENPEGSDGKIVTQDDGSVLFEDLSGDNGSGTEDKYRIRAYYKSIDEFLFTIGDRDGGAAYFGLDLSRGVQWQNEPVTSQTIAPKLVYSNNETFSEASTNDGSIGNNISIDLVDANSAIFSSDPTSFITVNNLPTGLNASISRNSDTKLTLSLTGNAINHTNANDINNLEIIFSDGAFSGITVDKVTKSKLSTMSIDFIESNNNPPVANSITLSVNEDNNLSINLSTYGSDMDDGDMLNYSIVSLPSNGLLSGIAPNLTFIPNQDFNGNDSFMYVVNDGELNSTIETISINVLPVNDAPIANDDSNTTDEDVAKVITVLNNDTDVENEIVTTTVVIKSNPSHGTVISQQDGTILYTPAKDYNGSDSFTYSIMDIDGNESNGATVTMNVNWVNDTPMVVNYTFNTLEDTDKEIDLSNYASDSDGNDTISTYTIVKQPLHGSLNGTGTNITYNPDANWYGKDTFTFQVTDDSGAVSNVGIISINVAAVNDAPVANADIAITNEDQNTTINILANDSDDSELDSDSVVIQSNPANGRVVIESNGSITYIPKLNWYGIDSFTYAVHDDGQIGTAGGSSGVLISNTVVVTVMVNSVNDAPVAHDDIKVLNEDEIIYLNLTHNDSDVENIPLEVNATTLSINILPTQGNVTIQSNGLVKYVPFHDYFGDDWFTYTITDSQGDISNEAKVSLNISAINDVPLIHNTLNSDGGLSNSVTENQIATGIDINATDDDGDMISFTLTGEDKDLFTIETNGTIVFKNAPNYESPDDSDMNNIYSFGVIVSDSNITDGDENQSVQIFIQVNNINEAIFALTDNVSTDEDTPFTINILENDRDLDDDEIIITSISSASHGNVINNGDGTINYTPNENYHGSDSFTYEISDNHGLTDSTTVTITVNSINDIPIITTDTNISITENTTFVIDANATDVDNDSLVFGITNGNDADKFSITSDGILSFKVAPDYENPTDIGGQEQDNIYILDINVSDGNGGVDVQTLTITIADIYEEDGISDVDKDGIPDSLEGNSTKDSDGDGIPDYKDSDSDGDGISDEDEYHNGNDIDNDGIPDYQDNDSDNDSVEDTLDNDKDNDGILDLIEDYPANVDTDNDGIPNYLDLDSDGDGKTDMLEGTDDDDLDGIANYIDSNDNGSDTPIDNDDGTQTTTIKKVPGVADEKTTSIVVPNNNPLNGPIDDGNNTLFSLTDPNIDINVTGDGGLDITNTNQDGNNTHKITVANPGADINITSDKNMIITTPIVINPDGSTCQYNLEMDYDGSNIITKHILNGGEINTTVIMKIPNASLDITSDNMAVHKGRFINNNAKDVNVTATVNCKGEVTSVTKIEDINQSFVAVDRPGSTVIIDTDGNVDISTRLEEDEINSSRVTGLKFVIDSDTADINTSTIYKAKDADEITLVQAEIYAAGSSLKVLAGSKISQIDIDLSNVRLITVDVRDENNNTITSTTSIDTSVTDGNITRLDSGEDGAVSTQITNGDSKIVIDNFIDGKAKHLVEVNGKQTEAISLLEGADINVTALGVTTTFEDISNNIKAEVQAINNGKAVHKLTNNGMITEAMSEIIGAKTLIDYDENNKTKIVTTIESINDNNQSLSIEVDALSNTQSDEIKAIHKVTIGTKVTQASSQIPGAKTLIKSNGEVETNSSILDSNVNIYVKALPNGLAIHEVKGDDFYSIATSSIKGAKTLIKSTGSVETIVEQEMRTLGADYYKALVVTTKDGKSITKIVQYDNNHNEITIKPINNTAYKQDNNISIYEQNGVVFIQTITPVDENIEF